MLLGVERDSPTCGASAPAAGPSAGEGACGSRGAPSMVRAGVFAFSCVNATRVPPLGATELTEMAADPIRVLLVDDHDVFRHGLAQLLGDEGLTVLAQASGGEAGVRLAAELAPDVVLMDLS